MLEIDWAGATAKFQSQTFKVARFCLRGKVDVKDAEYAELDPLHARMRTDGPAVRDKQGQQDMGDETDLDAEKGYCTLNEGGPESGLGHNPAVIPAAGTPSLSVQLPSPRGLPGEHPGWESSFDNKCEMSQAPVADRAQYDQLTWDRLRDPCS